MIQLQLPIGQRDLEAMTALPLVMSRERIGEPH